MPDSHTPDPIDAALAQHAPHLHALYADTTLTAQLRRIEEQEALVHHKRDLATLAGMDSAEHPTDVEKFEHALRVAREESAATIELETMRVGYITAALELAKKAVANASLVPV